MHHVVGRFVFNNIGWLWWQTNGEYETTILIPLCIDQLLNCENVAAFFDTAFHQIAKVFVLLFVRDLYEFIIHAKQIDTAIAYWEFLAKQQLCLFWARAAQYTFAAKRTPSFGI